MNFTSEQLNNYCIEHSQKISEICQNIKKDTFENVYSPQMLSGEIENSLLGLLIKSIKAKTIIEIGTYTGFATLCMAENSDNDALIHTFDIDEKRMKANLSFWEQSKSSLKIKTYIGPALENLNKVEGNFDFVFIDADKRNYLNYFEYCLSRLNDNGIIAIDNALWSGKVIGPIEENDHQTKVIHQLNERISRDDSLYKSLLPVRDGIMLVRKI